MRVFLSAFLAMAASALAATVTRGPFLQVVTPTSAVIRWRTDVATDSKVNYGTVQGTLTQSTTVATAVTEHVVTISGLSPLTTYYYSVGSTTEVLAGDTAGHFVKTHPTVGQNVATRIWVVGDSGTGDTSARNVRNGYLNSTTNHRADLCLMLGDNAYPTTGSANATYGVDADYQRCIFDIYPTILTNTPLWPTIGNHDTPNNSATADANGNTYGYFSSFTIPTAGESGGLASGTMRYYSFDYGQIHFVCLDPVSSSRATTGPMLTWLANDLAATTQRWIIAFFHYPPYSFGSENSDSNSAQVDTRAKLLPVLEAGGVDLVLCGHSHCYERSFLLDGHYGLSSTLTNEMKIDAGDGRESGNGAYRKNAGAHYGAVYAVVGSSGKTAAVGSHPVMITHTATLGSMLVDIDGDRLDASFIKTDGTSLDSFTLMKNPIVSITASGIAREQNNASATVTLVRATSSSSAVNVNTTIGGTANSGVDYTALPSPMTIPGSQNTAQFSITPLTDDLAEDDETVTITLAPGTGYQVGTPSSATVTLKDLPLHSWRKAKFGAQANNAAVAADSADPDGDLLPNVLEYAFGQDPMVNGHSGRPSAGLGQYLSLSFMRAVSASDLTFTVQVADNPDGPWTNGSVYSESASTPNTAATTETSHSGGSVESIVVRDNVPVSGATKRFIRLEVKKAGQ